MAHVKKTANESRRISAWPRVKVTPPARHLTLIKKPLKGREINPLSSQRAAGPVCLEPGSPAVPGERFESSVGAALEAVPPARLFKGHFLPSRTLVDGRQRHFNQTS